jgi:carboxylesterase
MSEHKIDMRGGEHAVLLIHGLTGSPFEMKYLARQLNRAGFTVKGPCLAGRGSEENAMAGLVRDSVRVVPRAEKQSCNGLRCRSLHGSAAGS